MLKNRIIPCLLLLEQGVVKTTRFRSPVYVGDPTNTIRIFNDKEVDEIILLDIAASRERREPDYALVEELAGECFMPLCYGGGISTLAQAEKLLKLGVEKLSVQSAALADINLVARIAQKFGSQAIVASVDVKRDWLGRPALYSASQARLLSTPWREHLQRLVQAGVGEILLNAVDRDGTMAGMDVDLIRQGAEAVPVPLTAIGGAGSLLDIKAAIDAGASAVAAGAFFVFRGKHRAVLITYPKYSELEKLLEVHS